MGVDEDTSGDMRSPRTFDSEKNFQSIISELGYRTPMIREDFYKLLEQVSYMQPHISLIQQNEMRLRVNPRK